MLGFEKKKALLSLEKTAIEKKVQSNQRSDDSSGRRVYLLMNTHVIGVRMSRARPGHRRFNHGAGAVQNNHPAACGTPRWEKFEV